jgi:hypothetical protein
LEQLRDEQQLMKWDTETNTDDAQRREFKFRLGDRSFSRMVSRGRLLQLYEHSNGSEKTQQAANGSLRLPRLKSPSYRKGEADSHPASDASVTLMPASDPSRTVRSLNEGSAYEAHGTKDRTPCVWTQIG